MDAKVQFRGVSQHEIAAHAAAACLTPMHLGDRLEGDFLTIQEAISRLQVRPGFSLFRETAGGMAHDLLGQRDQSSRAEFVSQLAVRELLLSPCIRVEDEHAKHLRAKAKRRLRESRRTDAMGPRLTAGPCPCYVPNAWNDQALDQNRVHQWPSRC